MADTVHIHEDDLELYCAGHLEAERVPALESHVSDCQECRRRLKECIGAQLAAVRKLRRWQGYLSLARMPIE